MCREDTFGQSRSFWFYTPSWLQHPKEQQQQMRLGRKVRPSTKALCYVLAWGAGSAPETGAGLGCKLADLARESRELIGTRLQFDDPPSTRS
jgi:hypothetical protein